MHAVTHGPAILDRRLAAATLAICVGLVAFKVFLIGRLNVNWDEFYYLSHVYSLQRGELDLILQGAYSHLFVWLLDVPGGEVAQVSAARFAMVGLLTMTAFLVWLLARVWLSGLPGLVPPLVYLSAMPVLQHGGSFRADSMLAPLSLAAVLLVAARARSLRRDLATGIALGAAFAVSIKAILIAPVMFALLLGQEIDSGRRFGVAIRPVFGSCIRIVLSAAIVASMLIALHWGSVATNGAEPISSYAAHVTQKTLLDSPLLAQGNYLLRYLERQPFQWGLILLGTALALLNRRLAVASMALSLLPIAFYRNSFPYYYVVMLAPASVAAGYAFERIAIRVRSMANPTIANGLVGALWLALLYSVFVGVAQLGPDKQDLQRQTVAGVHAIFPEPTNYLDRCGMIASHRKVNFFMSTWGIENYRKGARPIMRGLVAAHQPSFILVNHIALNPAYRGSYSLLPEDRDFVARYYPSYWGPVRVAGARSTLSGTSLSRLVVPFPGKYRLDAAAPVIVDGTVRQPGDVLLVPADGVIVQAADSLESVAEVEIGLVLASARPPPREVLPNVPLFDGL